MSKTLRMAVIGAAVISGLLAPRVGAAQPFHVANARVTSERAAGTLADTINKLLSRKDGTLWAAWDEPMTGAQRVCCFDSVDTLRSPCAGGCRLDSEDHTSSFFDGEGGDCSLEDSDRILVFLRLQGGAMDRLRIFSNDCRIDGRGAAVVWLGGVRSQDSIAFLEKLAGDPSLIRSRRGHSGEPAISAIAMHDDPAADAALERLVAAGKPEDVRKQAAFWLGNARGKRGYEVLARLAAREPSEELRRHVTFALSQSKEPQAIDTLIAMAKSDRSSSVRGQALFWLAQKAGKRAAGTIEAAIEDDPETEVKKKAVFALTQLPKDEGVPQLIRVARTNRNPAVRKQAVFWLGQSNDPRALTFFEEILAK